MEKIKEYKIGKRGIRGFVISLPIVWLRDMNLQESDKINLYREEEKLILIPNKKK